jgi:hypothetical protein
MALVFDLNLESGFVNSANSSSFKSFLTSTSESKAIPSFEVS